MPGLDAHESGGAGLAPQQGVGEFGNVADHATAGVLFVQAQPGGAQVHHAVAVLGKEILVNGNGLDVGGHQVEVAVEQAVGQGVQAHGRLQLVKPQLIVLVGVLVIKGNGKGGVIADAEGHGFLVQVFHRQGVMHRVCLQGEGGNQTEFIGELGQGLLVGAQLQHNGVLGLIHKFMLHLPGKAVGAGLKLLSLGQDLILGHPAAVGEEDGCMVAPYRFLGLPDVLHAVAFADDGLDLGTPGGDGKLQVFVFNGKFPGHIAFLLFISVGYRHPP